MSDCGKHTFTDYYATSEVQSIFRAIYDNKYQMQDKFLAYWLQVAKSLSANPYVVGFDPINEPGPGFESISDTITNLLPGQFDANKLNPMYEKIFAKLKSVSTKNVMWFEPCQFPDGVGIGVPGYPGVFNVGFKKPPGGVIGSANHILNDHAYCCQASPEVCTATGEPQAKDKTRCADWHKKKIGKRATNAKTLGVPLFWSEFGSCMNTDECVTEITQVCDNADAFGSSGWAYWQYKNYKDLTSTSGDRPEGFFNSDGTLQTKKVKALSRTYLKHTQGTILGTKFAHEDDGELKAGQFVAEIEVDSNVEAPSVLHAFQYGPEGMNGSETWYPNGFDVTYASPEGLATPKISNVVNEEAGSNDFGFQVQDQNFDGKVLRICVTPKGVDMDCNAVTGPRILNEEATTDSALHSAAAALKTYFMQ